MIERYYDRANDFAFSISVRDVVLSISEGSPEPPTKTRVINTPLIPCMWFINEMFPHELQANVHSLIYRLVYSMVYSVVTVPSVYRFLVRKNASFILANLQAKKALSLSSTKSMVSDRK